MTIHTFPARLEIMKWRDGQLEAVSAQLQENLPALLAEISRLIDLAGALETVTLSAGVAKSIRKVKFDWINQQYLIALRRADTSLDETLSDLNAALGAEAGVKDAMLTGVTAAAGLSAIAGSIAVIPTLITTATVTTGGVLGFFATTTVSVPILVTGGLGIGVAAVTGSTVLRKSFVSAKRRLRRRIITSTERDILGLGAPIGARSVLTDVQAKIIREGQNKIERLT